LATFSPAIDMDMRWLVVFEAVEKKPVAVDPQNGRHQPAGSFVSPIRL